MSAATQLAGACGGGASAPLDARERRVLGAIALLALALRAWHWQRTPVMFNDGPRFLSQANHFFQGDWAAGFADVYHPLYALAIAGVQAAFGPAEPSPAAWENAGAAVSIAAGVAGVVAFYFFVRSAFDRSVAWIAALLLAVHPYTVEFSADVQSDGLYHALFLWSVMLAWSAVDGARPSRAAWAGLFAGLAYLTRPEGLGVALVAGAMGALRVARGEWRRTRALGWAGALAAGALLVVGPYVVSQSSDVGAWTLTRKKSVTALAGVGEAEEVVAGEPVEPGAQAEFSGEMHRAMARERQRRESEWAREPGPGPWRRRFVAVSEVFHAGSSALRPETLLLAFLGILSLRGRPGLRGLFLLGLAGVYGVALLGLMLNYGYVSRRHALPPASLLLAYAAVGAPLLGGLLLAAAGRVIRALRSPAGEGATALGLAVFVCLALAKQLRPIRPDSLAERRAAEWVHDEMNPAGPVAADRRRVAYYANAPWFPLRKVPPGAPLAELLRSNGVRFVIADEGDLDRHPALGDPAALGRRVVYRAEAGGSRALVFDLDAPEGG